VHTDDFFPTVLDVVGVEHPVPERERDGQSIGPLLSGQTFERNRPLFWHYPHQWYKDVGVGLGIEPFSAMRKGRYKLIYFYGDGVADEQGEDPRVELYDLSLDLSEAHNLALTQPKRCNELREELFAWLRQVGAGIPVVKATGKPAELVKG
jgi:arylsulfatase A-like enzyme